MAVTDLYEAARGVADINGRAQATLQPLRSQEQWNITLTTVASTSTVLVPIAKVYRGMESPTTLIEGSMSASLDSSDTVIKLRNGEALVCVWTGCDVGSTCTLTVQGTKQR